ncbi:MAG: hypothetical protein GXY61_00465 [Lentisphaerae bacterium]|nr:hypothetical protein [Lentisphaerota bacterium]
MAALLPYRSHLGGPVAEQAPPKSNRLIRQLNIATRVFVFSRERSHETQKCRDWVFEILAFLAFLAFNLNIYYGDKKAEYAANSALFTIVEHDYLTVRYYRNLDIDSEKLWIKRIAISPPLLQNTFFKI